MKTVTLQFTDAELAVIRDALGGMPFKQAAPVVGSMIRQLQAQRQAEAAPELPPKQQNGQESIRAIDPAAAEPIRCPLCGVGPPPPEGLIHRFKTGKWPELPAEE